MSLKLSSLEKALESERERVELYRLKLAKYNKLEEERVIREHLPHLYLHKRYNFQKEFEAEIEKKYQIIVSANQVSKSSTAIQRVIKIATEPESWVNYWPEAVNKGLKPAQWWYLYPSMDVATAEWNEKWHPLMPKYGEKDPKYGWKITKGNRGSVKTIEFNTGITVYFKSYEQSVQNLQSGSCYLIVCDEELPVHLLPELQMRVNATAGYMWFVFTATLGQDFWRDVVELKKKWKTEARIWQLSLYDCQRYADGSPSKWTNERIKETIAKCTSEAEVQRRVFGKFIRDEGLAYQCFDRNQHLVAYHNVPNDWILYAGIDYGSGGKRGHLSAISVVAVNPTKTRAKVIRMWRAKEGATTTCRDVVDEYSKIIKTLDGVDYVYYDFSAKDLATFAAEVGLPFNKANKDRAEGRDLINTLFKTNRLEIMYSGSEQQHVDGVSDEHLQGMILADELGSLSANAPKQAAKDDAIDSLRYALNSVGFDWNVINDHGSDIDGEGAFVSRNKKSLILTIDEIRAQADRLEKNPNGFGVAEELEFWSQQLESEY